MFFVALPIPKVPNNKIDVNLNMPDQKTNKECKPSLNKVIDVLGKTNGTSNGAIEASELCHNGGPGSLKVNLNNELFQLLKISLFLENCKDLVVQLNNGPLGTVRKYVKDQYCLLLPGHI